MPLIRCTKKLIAEMGTQVALSVERPHAALLGDWYGNLLRIDRRKCLIFTSERTLFTVLMVALGRDAIRDCATLFRRGLRQVMASEEFAPDDVDRVLDDYQELTIAPTTDRSVLGSLNDLARMAVAHVQYVGGLSSCDLDAINHELNLTPMSRLGMASPLATTRRVLERGDLAAHAKGRPSPRRKKRPGRMELDAVEIDRRGDAAIITPRDPDVAVTHFQIGTQLARMSDEEILACFNETIDAMDRLAAEHPYVATEVPPGQPQIRYFAEGDQWVPRGGVVRCLIESDEDGQISINVDDRELSLDEFGRLLATYEGWGMRIEFTPEDATDRRPRLEVGDPDEPK
jgi:hypothetical protein